MGRDDIGGWGWTGRTEDSRPSRDLVYNLIYTNSEYGVLFDPGVPCLPTCPSPSVSVRTRHLFSELGWSHPWEREGVGCPVPRREPWRLGHRFYISTLPHTSSRRVPVHIPHLPSLTVITGLVCDPSLPRFLQRPCLPHPRFLGL